MRSQQQRRPGQVGACEALSQEMILLLSHAGARSWIPPPLRAQAGASIDGSRCVEQLSETGKISSRGFFRGAMSPGKGHFEPRGVSSDPLPDVTGPRSQEWLKSPACCADIG